MQLYSRDGKPLGTAQDTRDESIKERDYSIEDIPLDLSSFAMFDETIKDVLPTKSSFKGLTKEEYDKGFVNIGGMNGNNYGNGHTPQVVHNNPDNPLNILLKNKKPNPQKINIELLLDLPSKNLINTLDEDIETETLKEYLLSYIESKLDHQEINEKIKQYILNFYWNTTNETNDIHSIRD